MAEAAITAAEDGTITMDVKLTHFTAQRTAALQMLTAHTAETLFLAGRTEAVSHWHPHKGWSHAGAHRPHVLQTFLMGHEVTYFTKESDESPNEVTAMVAESRFCEGHFPKAVSWSVDLVPCPGAWRLLCFFSPRLGALASITVLNTAAICHCENRFNGSSEATT